MVRAQTFMMEADFTTLPAADHYRLPNFVGQRPIALVTTLNPDGTNNAAPMSFFNVIAHEPPVGSTAKRNASSEPDLDIPAKL